MRCEARLPAGLSSTTYPLVAGGCKVSASALSATQEPPCAEVVELLAWRLGWCGLRGLVELAEMTKAPTAVCMYLRSTRTSDRQHPKCRQYRPARPDHRECLAFQPPGATYLPYPRNKFGRTKRPGAQPQRKAPRIGLSTSKARTLIGWMDICWRPEDMASPCLNYFRPGHPQDDGERAAEHRLSLGVLRGRFAARRRRWLPWLCSFFSPDPDGAMRVGDGAVVSFAFAFFHVSRIFLLTFRTVRAVPAAATLSAE